MAQLPSGAAGTAAGVLIWSFTCLIFNAVLLWLLWTTNERRSCKLGHTNFRSLCMVGVAIVLTTLATCADIFLISCVAFLASTTSIMEQIHDIM